MARTKHTTYGNMQAARMSRRTGYLIQDRVKSCDHVSNMFERLYGSVDEEQLCDFLASVMDLPFTIGNHDEDEVFMPWRQKHIEAVYKLLSDTDVANGGWNWNFPAWKKTETSNGNQLCKTLIDITKEQWDAYLKEKKEGSKRTAGFGAGHHKKLNGGYRVHVDYSEHLAEHHMKGMYLNKLIWVLNSNLSRRQAGDLAIGLYKDFLIKKNDYQKLVNALIRDHREHLALEEMKHLRYNVAGNWFDPNKYDREESFEKIRYLLGNLGWSTKGSDKHCFDKLIKWYKMLPAGELEKRSECAWLLQLVYPETEEEKQKREEKEKKGKKRTAATALQQPSALATLATLATAPANTPAGSTAAGTAPAVENPPSAVPPVPVAEVTTAGASTEASATAVATTTDTQASTETTATAVATTTDAQATTEATAVATVTNAQTSLEATATQASTDTTAVGTTEQGTQVTTTATQVSARSTATQASTAATVATGNQPTASATGAIQVRTTNLSAATLAKWKEAKVVDITEDEIVVTRTITKRAKKIAKVSTSKNPQYKGPKRKPGSREIYNPVTNKEWIAENNLKFQVLVKLVDECLGAYGKFECNEKRALDAKNRKERSEKAARKLGFLPPSEKLMGEEHVVNSMKQWVNKRHWGNFRDYLSLIESLVGEFTVGEEKLKINFPRMLAVTGSSRFSKEEQSIMKLIVAQISNTPLKV